MSGSVVALVCWAIIAAWGHRAHCPRGWAGGTGRSGGRGGPGADLSFDYRLIAIRSVAPSRSAEFDNLGFVDHGGWQLAFLVSNAEFFQYLNGDLNVSSGVGLL